MATVAHPPENSRIDYPKIAAELTVYTAFFAISGALAGYFFSVVDPAGGAIFGAAYGLSSEFAAQVLSQVFGNSGPERTVKFVGRFIFAALVGMVATQAAGFSLSFKASLTLPVLMIPTALISYLVFNAIDSCSRNLR